MAIPGDLLGGSPTHLHLNLTHPTLSFQTGRLYAVPGQWPVHHGRIGQCIPLHPGRTRIHHHGPDSFRKATIESATLDFNGIPLHHCVLLHHLDFYPHEAAELPQGIGIQLQYPRLFHVLQLNLNRYLL